MKIIRYILLLLLFTVSVNVSARQYPKSVFVKSGYEFIGLANIIYFEAELPNINLNGLNTADKITSYQNTVELVLKNHSAFDKDAKVTVTAFLKYFLINNSDSVNEPISLELNIKSGALVKSDVSGIYAFTNAYKVELIITDVAVDGSSNADTAGLTEKLKNAIELNISFQKESITRINYNTVVSNLIACRDAATDEMVVSWSSLDDAEEYELEYTFVDDYSADINVPLNPAQISFNFKENSTRISLKEAYYRFPLLYERGYILYRVRAIGRGGNNLELPVYCKWSGNADKGLVSNFSHVYYHNKAHIDDKMNWQVISSFAEEGKRSDVVNYFDGTFRTRQTVTGVNLEKNKFSIQRTIATSGTSIQSYLDTPTTLGEADNAQILNPSTSGQAINAQILNPSISNCSFPGGNKVREVIAGETVYDYQGRPAVNILPTPANSGKIEFLPHLNISDSLNKPYNWKDFDNPNYSCANAGKLSSALNNGIMGASAYYSQNNPNKLGFNAFLPEAKGYPFTQLSYLQDNTGRVAAQSGLGDTFRLGKKLETRFYYASPNQYELDRMFGTEAGDALRYQKNAVRDPNGQISIEYINPEGKTIATALAGKTPPNLQALDNQNENTITISLLNKNILNTNDKTLITEHQFLVTSDNTEYIFDYNIIPEIVKDKLCDGTAVCLDCIYDISITLNHVESCSNVSLFSYTGTIGDLLNSTTNQPDLSCSNNSSTGDYPRQIIKTLDVGTYVITKKIKVNEQAALAYVAEVFKDTCKWDEILSSQLALVDTMDCYRSCFNCPQPPVQTALCDTAWCKPNPNRCDVIRGMLLSDISPGGQYAQFVRDANNNVDASAYPLSIFYQFNKLPYPSQFASHKAYLFFLLPNNFPQDYDSLADNWLPEYAEMLLPLHPEYCMLAWCDKPVIDSTLDFDVKILSTRYFEDALDSGYVAKNIPKVYTKLIDADPWFADSANQLIHNLKLQLLNKLENYGCDTSTMPIDTLAMIMAYCAHQNPLPDMSDTMILQPPPAMDPTSYPCNLPPDYFDNHDFGMDTSIADLEWTFLRSLYLSAKNEIIQQNMRGFANYTNCNINCIGSDHYWHWWGNFPYWNQPPPCNLPSGNNFLYAEKDRRFETNMNSMFNALEYAGISIDISSLSDTASPCEYAQLIASQSDTINQQFSTIFCGDTIPCEIADSLLILLNAMLFQLQNNTAVTYTSAQLPQSIINAGITGIIAAVVNKNSIRITLQPCRSPIIIPFLPTPAGLVAPVSLCCISNIACPNNNNCSFSIKVTYTNGATNTIQIQTKCDFLKDCADPALLCQQSSPYEEPIKNYLNSIFHFIASGGNPTSPILLNLLPAVLKEKDGQTAYNVTLSELNNFVVEIYYNPLTDLAGCIITLQPNSSISNWNQLIHINSITPDFNFASNGITHAFTLKVFVNNNVNISEVDVKGSADCWPINQCPPEITFCDTIRVLFGYPDYNDCVDGQLATAYSNAALLYQSWIDSVKNDLLEQYYAKCLKAAEVFNMTYTDKEYHYTLYYYDQAGDLVKTIPPAGVKLLNPTQTAQVKASRSHGYNTPVLPLHVKQTLYCYNTLNQSIWQKTPDAGESNFYYDGLGRIVASQNAQQKQDGQFFSYTRFDKLGRTIETGKIKSPLINATLARDFENWYNFIDNQQNRSEITFTKYDEAYTPAISHKFGSAGQRNLRSRVASVFIFENKNKLTSKNYTCATHYTYDIQGNVYKLILDYPNGVIGDKTIEYDYDLQSGKVNIVTYQRGASDLFMHRYGYDASNRLTRVETSANGLIWDTDAEYFYYRHGSLARTELGADKVQGLDYLYTLQGWIKGVNGAALSPETDMGQDGGCSLSGVEGSASPQYITINGVTYPLYNINQLLGNTFNGPGYGTMNNATARDAFGYALDYFKNDYKPVSGNACLDALQQTTGTVNYLYNGNIARMYTQLQNLDNNGFNYTYDQLNRIKAAQAWKLDSANNYNMALLPADAYSVNLNYDADGNILTLKRNATPALSGMDNLKYFYYPATNKLAYVTDNVAPANYADDIDNQTSGNYEYDKIGNLTKDKSEEIDKIKWNNYGKVSEIIRVAGSIKPNIKFSYNPMGERIEKSVIFANNTAKNFSDYYMRDAQGNIMAIYRKDTANNNAQELRLQELSIYGSSRIGVYKPDIKIPFATNNVSGITPVEITSGVTMHSTNLYGGIIYQGSAAITPNILVQKNTGANYTVTRGNKQYELGNHLGNVLVTVSDKKIPHNNNGTIDYYTADITSATDYYPFGMEMPGRNFSSNTYKFGFNGQEKDDEIAGVTGANTTAMYWEYDTRIGKRWNLDPKPTTGVSNYACFNNNPIWKIDPNGDDDYTANRDGTVNKKGTKDKTDNFYVTKKDGTIELVARNVPKIEAAGKKAGTTIIMVEFPKITKYTNLTSESKYIIPEMAAALFGSAEKYNEETNEKIQFTQLNAVDGSHSYWTAAGKKTPGTGFCFDMLFASTDKNSATTGTLNYNKENSEKIAASLFYFGIKTIGASVKHVSAEDPKTKIIPPPTWTSALKNSQPWSGHDTHIHGQCYDYDKLKIVTP